jgi:hypothetical protein
MVEVSTVTLAQVFRAEPPVMNGGLLTHPLRSTEIAGSILLCLLFIGLVYDLIAGYSARRRFAKLLSLKRVWHGGKSCATAAPPISGRAYRALITQPSRRWRVRISDQERQRTA